MPMTEKGRASWAGLLDKLATEEGRTPSTLKQVRFFRVTHGCPRSPVVYEPSIIIVGQGRKIGYLGDKVYAYDANNYLLLSVPLPFECETRAQPGKPFLAVSIDMESRVVSELLDEMDDGIPPLDEAAGICSTPLSEDMSCATERLLECLGSEMESRILGPQIVREITYYALKGPQGSGLRALVSRDSRFAQVAKALKRMHADYAEDLDLEDFARAANMSVSAFHRNFKAVTSSSPLQYLKSVRLHKARALMAQEGLGASLAAERVGYSSASQFSREFKRLFGECPRASSSHKAS
jgi:AraC-like DNA-binding protein